MKNNIELRDFAKKFLGQGGYTFRSYCGLGSGSPWCNAFVTYIMHKGGFASLYCNGKKQTYCPNSIKWCQNNLADIPIYLALPMDIVYFDWEGNGVPNHIGFAWERNTDQSLYTIEGNTSGGIVARKTRSLYNKKKTIRYIQAVFRPHYTATFDISKPLTVDGYFGYSSIALLQKVLGLTPDGILGKGTVKALQKIAGVSQDGSWGKKTSKAVQKMVGVDADGEFGPKSVKALQTWINKKANFSGAKNEKKSESAAPKPATAPATDGELVVDGHGGPATVKAMQRFFGTSQDGVISGQNKDLKKYYSALESVEFGKDGSVCIKKLQKWVGANEDGILGQITVKLWQKKIGIKQSGYFGPESMKTWQTYLNTHDKATYPTPAPTPSNSEAKHKDELQKKVYIGQACSNYDGKAGDGNKKEVLKSDFKYSSSSTSPYNWTYVFRPKNAEKAAKAASMCEKAIANNNIGYSKAGETAYGKNRAMTKLAKEVNYDLSKIKVKCGLSCGDLICLCNHYAGLSTCYIGSGLQLANNLKKNGNFTCIKYKKGIALKRGDTIITAHSNGKHNHVAMVL